MCKMTNSSHLKLEVPCTEQKFHFQKPAKYFEPHRALSAARVWFSKANAGHYMSSHTNHFA